MVEYNPDALDATFQALADRTRRAILARLCQGDASIGELARPFDMSFSAVSKHVRVLESAGLLSRSVEGREHRCGLNPAPLEATADWSRDVRKFWEQRLQALDGLVKRKRPQLRKKS